MREVTDFGADFFSAIQFSVLCFSPLSKLGSKLFAVTILPLYKSIQIYDFQ